MYKVYYSNNPDILYEEDEKMVKKMSSRVEEHITEADAEASSDISEEMFFVCFKDGSIVFLS